MRVFHLMNVLQIYFSAHGLHSISLVVSFEEQSLYKIQLGDILVYSSYFLCLLSIWNWQIIVFYQIREIVGFNFFKYFSAPLFLSSLGYILPVH